MSAIDLLTEICKLAEIIIGKKADWTQEKKDIKYKKLARYKKLKTMDRRYVNQEELLNLEDELAIFVKTYREELES